MGSYAREGRGTVMAALVAVVLVLLAVVPAAATAAAAPAPRSLTDAQLAARARQLDATASAIGEQLLDAAGRRDRVEQERDVASSLLAGFLADAYKHAETDGDLARQLLEAGSIEAAADRLRIADYVGDYHGNILRSLARAEAALDLEDANRAHLVVQLTAVQRQLVRITDEQGRRAAIHAKYEADRRARAEARAAREARAAAAVATIATPGALVADSGAVSSVVPFAPAGTQPTAQLIDAYLASKGSPMAGQGAAFMASGARWQVDPRLLVAIAGAESNFGQVTCGPNNAWGWACPNDPADFATWAHGIDTVTSGLRRYYLDEGRTSVSLIQQKYCPVGAANDPTGLNSHWRTNVTRFLLELGGNPAVIGPGPTSPSALGVPGFGIFGGAGED
jgi:hypothetical protein